MNKLITSLLALTFSAVAAAATISEDTSVDSVSTAVSITANTSSGSSGSVGRITPANVAETLKNAQAKGALSFLVSSLGIVTPGGNSFTMTFDAAGTSATISNGKITVTCQTSTVNTIVSCPTYGAYVFGAGHPTAHGVEFSSNSNGSGAVGTLYWTK